MRPSRNGESTGYVASLMRVGRELVHQLAASSKGGDLHQEGFNRVRSSYDRKCPWLKLMRGAPGVGFAREPMASPETTISTRLFCCLPTEESLLATGSAEPIPQR